MNKTIYSGSNRMEARERVDYQASDDEIDLADIIRQLWGGRKIIIITVIIFVVSGIGYAVYKTRNIITEYQSQMTLFVESPSTDSLLKVFTYPPFFSGLMQSEIVGLNPDSVLSIKHLLDRQTPPQGSIASLMSRVTAIKGDANTLVIRVKMQDPALATQLGERVTQELTQFLPTALATRVEKVTQQLKEDSLKNLQRLIEGISRSQRYALRESSQTIQILTDAYTNAEQAYLQSQKALTEFYRENSANQEPVDSLEVKRLNSDIKLKYTIYSSFYSQLNQAKLEAEKQSERMQLDAERQVEQAGTEVSKQIELVKLNAGRQQPEITILESATSSVPVTIQNRMKIPLIALFLGLIAGVGIVFGRNFYRKNFSPERVNHP